MEKFVYDGRHLMIDAVVEDGKKLYNGSMGEKMIEDVVETIDMTMILPPVTVKFPHSTCEMRRVLKDLQLEGLGSSSTAQLLDKRLKERQEESYGYSTFAMIAESHLSIHTFPELGYFTFTISFFLKMMMNRCHKKDPLPFTIFIFRIFKITYLNNYR